MEIIQERKTQIGDRTVRTLVMDNGQEVGLWYKPESLLPYSAEWDGGNSYADMSLDFVVHRGEVQLDEYDGWHCLPRAVAAALQSIGVTVDID